MRPPAFRQAGFLAEFVGVGKEDLASDGEGLVVGEPGQERREEIGFHPHVAVEQHDNVVLRGTEARIGAAAKSEILIQREDAHLRESFSQKRRAPVFRTVVHDNDFAVRTGFEGGGHRGQIFFEQVAAIPIRNDDTSVSSIRSSFRRQRPAWP